MANTNATSCARQEPLAFIRKFTLAEFVAASNVIDIAMPVNAVVTSGLITITTAFDSGTTDVIVIGDSATANRYKTSLDLKTAAATAIVPTGYISTAAVNTVRLTRTPVGTAAAAGEVMVNFTYLVLGRTECTQD